jgi:CRP-like cAMP-binding protein
MAAVRKVQPFRNLLLGALPRDQLGKLSSSLEAVALPRRMQLELPNKKIEYVYFLDNGIASVVAVSASREEVEVGIIGHEGMTGLPLLHQAESLPYSIYMQVGGSGRRVKPAVLQDLLQASTECRGIFLGFAQALFVQAAETSVANARATIEQRLARWLLMVQDRLGGNAIPLTHEYLSLMMAARRPGVTEASLELAREGLLSGKRGVITIIDRAGLEARAGRYYGVPEQAYRKALGRKA